MSLYIKNKMAYDYKFFFRAASLPAVWQAELRYIKSWSDFIDDSII